MPTDNSTTPKNTSATGSILADFLDSDQLRAVQHRGANLLIIAGAGSGKTRTLTHRAISFLKVVQPENLMVVTFTKKAANELLRRITSSVLDATRRTLRYAWIGTIHSICWRILMENGHLVGLKPYWSVLDMPDSERVMRLAVKSTGFSKSEDAKSIYQLYSYARNSMTNWQQWVKSQRFPNVANLAYVQKAIESYSRRCRRSNRVDFDDLQVLALRLLKENPEVRAAYQERFKVIMVDEYQDTNRIQARLLELLQNRESTITVVGDDAQSIYGFRAATVENILNFESSFRAHRVTIGTNYRSTPEIVALANASIRHNTRQIFKDIHSINPHGQKPLFFSGTTPNEEAKFVLRQLQEQIRHGVKLEEVAVLFRATRQAAALELELRRAGIPYVVIGGEGFFGLEHIKIIMDMARLLVNPEDSIALGALQELIGFASASTLDRVEQQADQVQLSFWDIVNNVLVTAAPSSMKTECQSLITFQREIIRLATLVSDGQSITPAISSVIEYLTPSLKKKYFSVWSDVLEDIATLQTVASQFTSLTDFLNAVALQQFTIDNDSETEKLVLSTIHSAKGLEWETVFVIGLVEFWFPLNYAIQQQGTDEEERRLFYVATTRAKKNLYLSSYAQAVNPYGKTMPQHISRFIQELPETVYEHK